MNFLTRKRLEPRSVGLYLALTGLCAFIATVQIIRLAAPDVDVSSFMVIGSGWLHGQWPYSALWDHKPPGLYLLAAAASAGGDVWTGIRVFSVAAITITAMLTGYLVGRCGANKLIMAITALVAATTLSTPTFTLGGGMSETLALPAMVAAIALALGPASRWRAFGSGLAAGVALSLSLQAVVVVPLIGFLVANDGRRGLLRLSCLAAGVALVAALLATPFALTGHLPAAVDALVNYNVLYHASAISHSPSFWLLVFGICGFPWIFALLVAAIPRGPKALDRRLFGAAWLWLALTLAWLIYGGRFYTHYALLFVAPAVLLFGLALSKISRLASRFGTVTMSLSLFWAVGAPLWIQNAPLNSYADTSAPANAAVAYIEGHSGPSDLIYVWGDAPQLYLSADRSPAGRYFYLLPLMTPGYTDGAVAQTLADWAAHPPTIIVDASAYPNQRVLAPLLVPHAVNATEDHRDLSAPLDPLRAFVSGHYRLAGYFGGLPVYQLEPSP